MCIVKHNSLQRVGVVSELLASMKLLCLTLWPQEVQAIDELRLDVALAMLKSPHFNAKMNALKEVTSDIILCSRMLVLSIKYSHYSDAYWAKRKEYQHLDYRLQNWITTDVDIAVDVDIVLMVEVF